MREREFNCFKGRFVAKIRIVEAAQKKFEFLNQKPLSFSLNQKQLTVCVLVGALANKATSSVAWIARNQRSSASSSSASSTASPGLCTK